MHKSTLIFSSMFSTAPFFMPAKTYLPILLVILLCPVTTAQAETIYQTQDNFVSNSFDGKPPETEILWLQDNLKKQIAGILAHNYDGQRIRYWRQGPRSAWVLEEIGKTKPITVGIVINNKKIEVIRVLIFRESRGWEVKYPFFSRQFVEAKLTTDHQLDKTIDGISGATLSVRAVSKLARIALLLDQQLEP